MAFPDRILLVVELRQYDLYILSVTQSNCVERVYDAV